MMSSTTAMFFKHASILRPLDTSPIATYHIERFGGLDSRRLLNYS